MTTQEKREKMQVSPEQFEDWLENPVTEVFMKYLKDSVKDESESVADLISGGGYISEMEQAKIGSVCVTLTSISEIELEEILEFYKRED